jgi:hypothetical protein
MRQPLLHSKADLVVRRWGSATRGDQVARATAIASAILDEIIVIWRVEQYIKSTNFVDRAL